MSNIHLWSKLVETYHLADIEEHQLGSIVRSKITPIEYNISTDNLTSEEIANWGQSILARSNAATAMIDFIKRNIRHT